MQNSVVKDTSKANTDVVKVEDTSKANPDVVKVEDTSKSNSDVVKVEDTISVDENWKWPCFEEYFDRICNRTMRKEMVESVQQNIPFKVVYSTNRYGVCKTFIELKSRLLINILRSILSDVSAILDKEPKVNAQNVYHIKDELLNADIMKDALKNAPDLENEKVHLDILNKFLENEYEKVTETRAWMSTRKVVSFDMLWIFYTPNLNVFYECEASRQKLCGIISSVSEEFDFRKDEKYFIINIKVIDYDGVGFKRCSIKRRIDYFKGEKSFSDLPVMPSRFSNVQDLLKETIAENGKRFFEIAQGNHFMNYKGPLMRWKQGDKCMQLEKKKADGRVMIDLQSFMAMNPGYSMMGNALPPSKYDNKLFDEMGVYLKPDQEHQEANYLLAPAIVFGFSFALKEWGQFEVSKFSDISFETDAINCLVMSQNKKSVIIGLVKQYSESSKPTNGNELDPISTKGNGCIFLCHGPPGTGKTLTAECVAEFLKRPLWVLSIYELGTKPEVLERQLYKVLDVAYKWKAVLLLDEADIYLEERNLTDLNRNMIVSIFLRLLEYYQGILFMTTNRVLNFDDAICSRISMFLHYPTLGESERREVWTNLIGRAKIPLEISNEIIEQELNGREIRNILHIAQMIAQSNEQELTAGENDLKFCKIGMVISEGSVYLGWSWSQYNQINSDI